MVLHIAYGAVINKADLSSKTVVEGNAVLWRCSVDNKSRHAQPNSTQFKWLRHGLPISFLEVGLRSHINNGEFGIVSVKRSDHGWYVCEASNGFIKPDTANVFLDVQYKPTISTTQIHFYTLPTNSSSQIECRFEANPPVTLIHWTKNGQSVPNSSPANPFVQVVDALENDSGVYTCRAENAVGTSVLVEVHVLVVEPPQFSTLPPPFVYISAGQKLEIECGGFGDPMPTQFWSRNGKRLPLSSPCLVIPYISHQDYGVYECTISNSVATLTHQTQCMGRRSLKLSWTPGYSGTNPQSFRIFHRQVAENKDWKTSEFIDSSEFILENLQDFGAYQYLLEASNKHGEFNCTLPRREYHTCSILHSPTNLRLDSSGNETDKYILVRWDKVLEASSYEVKYRPENHLAYRKLTEVKEPEIRLDKQKLNFNHSIEFTVQSLRPFYNSSEASEKIVYIPAKPHLKFANGYLLAGGLVLIITCLCLLLVNRKKRLDSKRRKINEEKQREVFGNYIFPHNLVSNEWWEGDDRGTSLNT
uniref:Uncharacterized protein n=1 Tax=Ditylenchus dipsaci TaxID=166011 RepID=A0A915EC74_9BILA